MLTVFVFTGFIWLNKYAYIAEQPVYHIREQECREDLAEYKSRSTRNYGSCEAREMSVEEYIHKKLQHDPRERVEVTASPAG